MAGRHSAGRTSENSETPVSGRDWKRTATRVGVTAAVLAVVILGVSLFEGAQRTGQPPAGSSGGTPIATITSSPSTQTQTPVITSTPMSTPSSPGAPASPSGSNNTPTTTGGLAAGIYANKIADLKSVVPSTFDGYDVRGVGSDVSEIAVVLQPAASTLQQQIRAAVVTISDRSSAAAAVAFVSGMDKGFGSNVMHATAGSATGVFGTDGDLVADFRFARGRYTVEVMITGLTGSAANLKTEALRLAAAMPASKP